MAIKFQKVWNFKQNGCENDLVWNKDPENNENSSDSSNTSNEVQM
jgi:hypothetical protein